jgi:hypothetical protein
LTFLVLIFAVALTRVALLGGGFDAELHRAPSSIATAFAQTARALIRDASTEIAVPRRAGTGLSSDAFVAEFQRDPVSFRFTSEVTASGETYISGTGANDDGVLLLYGPPSNLAQVALSVRVDPRGLSLLQRFRQVADPTWTAGDGWLASSVRDGVAYHRVAFGAHVYTLLVTPESGATLLSVASPDENSSN